MITNALHVCQRRLLPSLLCLTVSLSAARADISLPNVFGDHMVLQQGIGNPVWGRATAGEQVTVEIADQRHQATADDEGAWRITLEPLSVGGPHKLTVTGADSTVRCDDVLVGEVWVCSGQSNMQWTVNNSNDADLERAAAHFPQIRMINFPQVGSQEPIWTHERQWMVCSPETVGSFSAVGYFFARQLHQTLDVPVGMINNAWGGSACEAWIDRDLLAADPQFQPLLNRWHEMEAEYARLDGGDWTGEEKQRFDSLKRQMQGNHRPGNIYNGVLKSHLGYGIRGAIWYQGESNAGRAYQYRELFPLMISSWRDEWGLGDFPFYWVQLADYQAERTEPGDSAWAELREAQTMTMDKLPHTGQAVIIDLGEGKDIHPRNKVDVGRRLARWALANEYAMELPHQSPRYQSMERQGDKVVLSFTNAEEGWRPFDTREPRGFAIAGDDRKFVWASARILDDNRVEVSSEEVPEPVAVRYGWADNPDCNLYDRDGLPLTPFRTDDWPGVTADAQ
jgi:sialate O-acetylesterase